jgi:hypothetical protein
VSQPIDLDQLRQRVIVLTDAAAKAGQKLAVATDKLATAQAALSGEFGVTEDEAGQLEAQLEHDLAAELERVAALLEEAGA